jgi:hypothetical protein
MVHNLTLPTLCVSYYFKLPQSTCAMISGNGQAYTLMTYAGSEDFCTLSPVNIQLQILATCMQDSPILLKASNFNLPSANTDAFEVGLKIERKIHRLAWPEICAFVFHEVFSGYSGKPHAALEHISQTYKDSNGTLVTTPVFAYYQRDMNAIRPFSEHVCFPVSVCNYPLTVLTSTSHPFSIVITPTTVNRTTCLLPISAAGSPSSSMQCSQLRRRFRLTRPSPGMLSAVKLSTPTQLCILARQR